LSDSLIDDLTDRQAVKRRLDRAGVWPSKRLGQNFLVDREVVAAVGKLVRGLSPEWIVEIGSGLGTITSLLARLAKRTIAIEVDPRLVEETRRTLGEDSPVEIRHQDFLSFDFTEVGEPNKGLVVGSIPYRISSPIIRHLVRNRAFIEKAILITQREVADKILSSPGRNGTALGVFVQAYADVAFITDISRRSFFPTPEVDSALWMISFAEEPRFTAEADLFFSLVRAIYERRRKMLRSALRSLLSQGEIEAVLTRAGLDGRIRGENLDLVALDRLANAIKEPGAKQKLEGKEGINTLP